MGENFNKDIIENKGIGQEDFLKLRDTLSFIHNMAEEPSKFIKEDIKRLSDSFTESGLNVLQDFINKLLEEKKGK